MKSPGNAPCEATVTIEGLNKSPIKLKVFNDQGGFIKVTCELFPNQPLVCEGGLDTSMNVIEDGHNTELKALGAVITSAASDFQVTPRGENSAGELIFEVTNYNAAQLKAKNSTEPPADVIIEHPKFKFVVPPDGQVYVVNVSREKMEPKLPTVPDPETGTSIDVQPQPFDAGSATEANKKPDLQTAPSPKGDGGCQTLTFNGAIPEGLPSQSLALILAALALLIRRKKA